MNASWVANKTALVAFVLIIGAVAANRIGCLDGYARLLIAAAVAVAAGLFVLLAPEVDA